MPREEGHSLRILGEIALKRGDALHADEYLQSSYRILREADDEYDCARTQLILSELYLAQNKYEDGLRLLDQCESIFERLEARLDLEMVVLLRSRFPSSTAQN
jgi:tetratricopeptide (TPR) repeat protein